MKLKITCFIVLFLMVSVNLLNTDNLSFAQSLEDEETSKEVILSLNSTNIPGFQEGSIFTDTTLTSGFDHTCAILDNGSVSCWGRNQYGQIGDGTATNRNTPTQTSGLGTGRTAVAISAGFWHTCAILDDGSVSCWGGFYAGLGATIIGNTPTQTSSLGTGRTAVAISSGTAHTCAILDDGSVSCWGNNWDGQLGDGTTTTRNSPAQTSSLGTGRTAVAISSGEWHTCAILDDASVSCWGYNYNGQLGDGTTTDRNTPTQTSSLGTGRTAVAISSGAFHTCAILDNASVSCWGINDRGQLGDGTRTQRNTPTQTLNLGTGRTAVAISSGYEHTCAILNDASVSCWGYNYRGQLGEGVFTNSRKIPAQTSSLGTGRTAVAISSGGDHTCAILDDASLSCWGGNEYGQLGDGTTTTRNTPAQTSNLGTTTYPRTVALSERDFDGDGVLNIFDVHHNLDYRETAISSGAYHTCAILDDGSVSCWGDNHYGGQLGDGTTTLSRNTPAKTSTLGTGRTAVAISSGGYHTCAILDDGSVSCWGGNDRKQLGDGTTTDRNTPTQTSSLGTGRTAVAISSGDYHTCAILDDGTVSCWGRNQRGQLGDGTTTNRNTPTQTSNLGAGRTAVAISSGNYHTCAILDDASVSCWGSNDYGQLGDVTTTSRYTPAQTSSLGTNRGAVAISSGWGHTCALLDDTSVSCWGYNANGELGDGTNTNRDTPTQTSSLGIGRTVIAISSGYFHTCAILDDGSVGCWGRNNDDQLGDGTTTSRNTTTQTSSLGTGRTAVAISSGSHHTCAILDDGTVSCWGDNNYAQLGDGTGGDFTNDYDRNTPTQTSSLGTTTNPRTALLVDGDTDGDGTLDHFDDFPNNSIRSIACTSGQYGRYLCVDSPAGKYVPSSSAMYATDCAAGTYQALTGQTSCDDAEAGYYVATTSQSSQTACSAGTYQVLTGQVSCDDADAGHYVDQTAQSSQIACLAGTYNPNNGSSSSSACGDADAGNYVDQTAQSSQTPCAIGTYQTITGQTSCDDADAGYYVNQTTQTTQIECAIGTYQALTGQSSCDEADAGYYVDQTAQYDQITCLVGTYNPNNGSSSPSACINADAGYFVNQIGQSYQVPCALGTYQSAVGQISCDDADAGYYVDQTAQTAQTECTIGTYQALTGQSFCGDADGGYYVEQTAQTTQKECAIGTYQALTGQASCNDADMGYYVSQIAQTTQTRCGSIGTYQPLTGQSSCDDADAGHYVNQYAQSSQTPCAIGTYQALTGQSSCDDADAGYYVSTTGQSNQTACAAGTYSNLSGSVECMDAGPGYYVLNSDRTDRIQCPLFTYTYVDENTSGNTSDELSDCWIDTDGDTLVDDDSFLNSDDDDDNDEFKDLVDAFPLDSSEWDDLNNDGVGDNQKPLNSFENMENDIGTNLFFAIAFIIPIGIIVGIVLILKSRKKPKVEESSVPVSESV